MPKKSKQKRANRPEEPPESNPVAVHPAIVAGLVLAAWLGLIAFVYGYGAIGEPFVDSLDERIGEVLGARAKRLAQAYRYDEAIALYHDALEAGFQDEPNQRLYTLRDLALLLEKLGRYEEGIEAAQAALDIKWNYNQAFVPLYRMLRETKRYDEALALMQRHYDRAEAANDRDGMVMAKFNQGVIYEAMNRPDDALAAYRACHEIRPVPRAALRIGRLLCARGETEKAKPYLRDVVRRGGGSLRREARAIARSNGLVLTP